MILIRKLSQVLTCLAATSVLLASANTLAGDIEAGKAKAAMCVSCHGQAGISPNELWPNLAGQKKTYMAKQLTDFKSGKRTDPVMASFAKMLSDEDIQNVAAYYSSLK